MIKPDFPCNQCKFKMINDDRCYLCMTDKETYPCFELYEKI